MSAPWLKRTVWLERLAWVAVGVAIGAAVLMLWPSGEGAPANTSISPAPPPDSQATGSPAEDSPDSDSPDNAPSSPDCFLGVVLAREAVDVSSETDGLIEEIRVRVGDRVERGQILARLDREVLAQQLIAERANLERVQAQSRRVEIEANQATQEHERRQTLSREGLLSSEEQEAAGFQSEKAGAALEAARAEAAQVRSRIRQLETTLKRTEIRAPFDGTVAQRYLDAGSRARVGVPVVRLLSSGNLMTRFAVPPESVTDLPLETSVRVEVEVLGQAFPATVGQIAPEIDATAQMVFIEAQLDALQNPSIEIPSGAVARVSVAAPGQASPSCLP